MKRIMFMIFIVNVAFAGVCEENKQKIEDKILWNFISENVRYADDYVKFCETLHALYPQMKANECQVVKVTQKQRGELCELLVAAYSFYGIKSKTDCTYTRTDKYVKDIDNLHNMLRKYVFSVKATGEVTTERNNICLAKANVKKYNYEVANKNVVIDKVKAPLKKKNDENKAYLEFVKSESMQKDAVLLYRFVGDRVAKDFHKYYEYKELARNIDKYVGYFALPIEYEVINWSELYRKDNIMDYKAIYDSNYAVKCYKKSPNDSVEVDYGNDITRTMTCAEIKSAIEAFDKAVQD